MMFGSFHRRTLVGATLVLALGFAAPAASAADLTVFAAASMKNALDAVDAAFTKANATSVAASFAASSALAKQIEDGAPADIFISADTDWMDDAATKGAIKPDTRVDLLGNRLVLVAQAGHPIGLEIGPGMKLAEALAGGRLAIPEVESVPAGKYGKAALIKLGVWASVADHLAPAENVRAALGFVSRGEAPLGIVYATDAVSDKGVIVVGTFPAESHPPIVYPVAITSVSKSPAAQAYMAFLRSPAAKPLFEAQGFTVRP